MLPQVLHTPEVEYVWHMYSHPCMDKDTIKQEVRVLRRDYDLVTRVMEVTRYTQWYFSKSGLQAASELI
jgi:hypothetical protein